MKDEVIARYRVETDIPMEKAAIAIAAEQSTGTWTEVKGAESDLAARVVSVEGNIVDIGFPVELFEPGNIPQYLSVIAGNLFGLGDLRRVRLLDVDFPESLLRAHAGPRFGIEDARRLIGVYDRPLVGTIVKPKVGLDPRQTAEVVGNAVRGGLDLVKDDETLTDQRFCPMEKRVEEVMSELDRVESETGKKASTPSTSHPAQMSFWRGVRGPSIAGRICLWSMCSPLASQRLRFLQEALMCPSMCTEQCMVR